ncbi:anhydro-N-acetylmuramic acid kinase [Tunturibacter empetritectus]|uniref:Anhydro-N-acetylmuramic acid kinase n=1 Tax=Tunturiibacter lichenicola TaxID=2051959 RepID=A0A7W8JA77_9BACT|nr:anhydro-N-acetylmuramic acid kinase [Edaphobacter lichenicola]MBB5345268.1 anhydro-N-acetylmuramic acid kinase [Edaphobacter lichenicola]
MKSLVVAGVMSGTSADGVDVAICRVSPALRAGGTPRIKLLGHLGVAYPKTLRAAVLSAMDAEAISVAELSRLNWRLGELYAEAVARAQEKFGVTVQLVGCHGQTIYHQGALEKYLGRALRATWQTGEAAVIAERLRVPVVSDFRPGDLAAGGQGAPLVPMLDYCMFRSAKVSRVLLNLGGIGNLTAIPAEADANGLMAFDTGPGNMVIDACMKRLYEREFDRGGAVARTGTVLRDVVEKILQETYFSALPPKSCGREQFGETFVSRFVAMCRKAGGREDRDEDVVATATALTAASIAQAYRRFVRGHVGEAAPLSRVEFVVAGGGTKNACLMRMLGAELEPMGVKVRLMEELGVPAQAKEAVAFALLAWLSWSGLPGNVPAATGAERRVVLGKVTHA